MKREAINEAEATLNEDILYPLADTMLECRRDALKLVNEKLREEGKPEITVEFNSVWAENRKHEKLSLNLIEAEIEEMEGDDKVENQGNPDDTTDSITD